MHWEQKDDNSSRTMMISRYIKSTEAVLNMTVSQHLWLPNMQGQPLTKGNTAVQFIFDLKLNLLNHALTCRDCMTLYIAYILHTAAPCLQKRAITNEKASIDPIYDSIVRTVYTYVQDSWPFHFEPLSLQSQPPRKFWTSTRTSYICV